jgi:hypothetical protein
MQQVIVSVAKAFAASKYYETTAKNTDHWIKQLWACYHPHGAYGAYCVVGAFAMIDAAFKLVSTTGKACIHAFPTRPQEGSHNKERTLYGNVYRTYMEIERAGIVPVGAAPDVGAVFFRRGNEAGHNHAGVVIATPLRDDEYIVTVEANTGTSGGSSSPKGFVEVTYTREAYERYQGQQWAKPKDAGTNYGNAQPAMWRFAYFATMCAISSVPTVTDYRACLNITVNTTTPPPPPVAPPCDPTKPPAARQDDDQWTQWELLSNIYPRTTGTGIQLRPSRDGDTQVSEDGCWVRFPKTQPLAVGNEVVVPEQTCKDKYILRSACEDTTGTTLRFGTATTVAKLGDLRDYGVAEALMSSVITRDDFMSRGHSGRAREVYDMVPMIATDNSRVFVMGANTTTHKIFEELVLWGPNVRVITIDRTRQPAGVNGAGGGWAERISRLLHPDAATIRFADADDNRWNLAGSNLSDFLERQGAYWKRENAQGIGGNTYLTDGYSINLHTLMQEWDKYAKANGNRSLAIVITGEPQSAWDAISGPLSVLTGFIPGVGPIASAVMATLNTIITQRGTALDAAFALAGGMAKALADGALGDKPFGVETTVFRSIAADTTRAMKIYDTYKNSANAGFVAMAVSLVTQFDREFPEVTSAVKGYLADEERWVRNAASEINRVWNGALGSVRETAHNMADGWSAATMGSLIEVAGGVDAVFAQLVAGATSITKSASQIPVVQEAILTKPDAQLLTLIPGMNRVVANILGNAKLYATDVQSDATHSALAAIALGKKSIDGALDGMTLNSLLYKAEDFARRRWDMDMPMTMPPDKAACFAKEVRIVTGLECCTPKTMVCGTCYDGLPPACPPGQYRDTDGCCIEQPPSTPQEGPRTPTTTTTDRPESIPDCIRLESPGKYSYCPSTACAVGGTQTPTVVYEDAIITVVNMNGAPFELYARRKRGTQDWAAFAVRAMVPQGNTWVPSNTIAWTPTSTSDILPGTTYTAAMFEAARIAQGITPTEVPTAPPPTATAAQCPVRYEARYSATPYPQWFANISGRWIEIVDCCPSTTPPPPPAAKDCCDDMKLGMAAINMAILDMQTLVKDATKAATEAREAAIAARTASGATAAFVAGAVRDLAKDTQRIEELILRAQAGEPIDLSDIRQSIDYIRENLPGQPTRYDDTRLLERLDSLERTVRDIPKPPPATAGYDDTALRREIAELKTLVTQRCQITNPVNYDARLDAIEAAIRSIVVPPPTITSSGEVVVPRIERDYTPILESIQRAIAELRPATGTDYTTKLEELRNLITRIPTACPACSPTDMAPILRRLDEVATNTARNYDTEFASIRAAIADIRTTPPTSYDNRFDQLERAVLAIRNYEAIDYSQSFAAVMQSLDELRRDVRTDDRYRTTLDAIQQSVRALELKPTPTLTQTVTEGERIIERIVPQPSDYRWDEVLAILHELRSRPTAPTEVRQACDNLQIIIDQAVERQTRALDTRYDLIRATLETMRSELQQSPDAPLAATDTRIDKLLEMLSQLQMQTALMGASVESTYRELQTLTANRERMDAAYEKQVASLRTLISQEGGTVEAMRELAETQADWQYQRQRYDAEIANLQQRLQEVAETAQVLPPPPTPVVPLPPQTVVPTPPQTVVPTPPQTVVPTPPQTVVPTPPQTVVPTPPQTSVPRTPPQTVVPRTPQTPGTAPCPDCPTVVERHERIIYGPLPQQIAPPEDECCDDC